MLGVLYNHPYVGNETHRTDAEHHLVPVLDTLAILYSPFLSSLQSVSLIIITQLALNTP